MFHSARITLTVWYLIIIMTISGVFSIGFYNLATSEFQRIIRIQEFRHENPGEKILRPKGIIVQKPSIQDLQEANDRLRFFLIVLNGIIFVVTGAAGYFLAGRTLRPIKEMVDEQNRFITDVSHELRTPLTSLRSEIEVGLRSRTMTLPDAKKLLQSNHEEVVRLQALSDNLLVLAQTGKTNASQAMEEMTVVKLLDEAIKKLNGSIKKKEIRIEKAVNGVKVYGMPDRLVEVLVILLDNAVKYSPSKSVVKVSAKRQDKTTVITVSDSGVGIPKEDLPKIFERFYRANKSRSSDQKGYGLGLSIAKKIVDAHGGTITATSIVGKGSTFTLYLPLE